MTPKTDLRDIDYDGFARELTALRAELDAEIGLADVEHLQKIERWGRACTRLGHATAWLAPNPISAALMAIGSTTRWTVMGHHVCHRGMDKASERARAAGADVPVEYDSKVFALGDRREKDWLDWIDPEAWNHEHNVMHHFSTGETLDPDLVEENMKRIRDANVPRIFKYLAIAFFSVSWKVSYYAPNTFQALKRMERTRAARRAGTIAPDAHLPDTEHLFDIFDPRSAEGREFWQRCIVPYATRRFVFTPLMYLPLGPLAVGSAAINILAAELLTNLHSFLVITPNHTGNDVYRFDGPARDRAEFFVRQVTGSVNMTTGNEIGDWLQGYLNYQIEHHLWPDLPPLKLRECQPRVRAICEKYGVPYVQEPMPTRVRKMVDVMVGKAALRRGVTLSRKEREALSAAAE